MAGAPLAHPGNSKTTYFASAWSFLNSSLLVVKYYKIMKLEAKVHEVGFIMIATTKLWHWKATIEVFDLLTTYSLLVAYLERGLR